MKQMEIWFLDPKETIYLYYSNIYLSRIVNYHVDRHDDHRWSALLNLLERLNKILMD